MTAEELWKKFQLEKGISEDDYEAWQFGSELDHLADLVDRGIKTATSSAYPLYEIEGEPLPEPIGYDVILNSNDEAICVIRTTKVYVRKYVEVDAEHAYKEGEGDRSLEYWRRVHEDFFTRELAQYGLKFDEEMKVVCEEFEVVYRARSLQK